MYPGFFRVWSSSSACPVCTMPFSVTVSIMWFPPGTDRHTGIRNTFSSQIRRVGLEIFLLLHPVESCAYRRIAPRQSAPVLHRILSVPAEAGSQDVLPLSVRKSFFFIMFPPCIYLRITILILEEVFANDHGGYVGPLNVEFRMKQEMGLLLQVHSLLLNAEALCRCIPGQLSYCNYIIYVPKSTEKYAKNKRNISGNFGGYTIFKPVTGRCAFASRSFRGRWKEPDSRRLYNSGNPSPSQYNAFILSRRLPQNRNNVLLKGSSWNCCCTRAAKPSIPRRRSV